MTAQSGYYRNIQSNVRVLVELMNDGTVHIFHDSGVHFGATAEWLLENYRKVSR